MSFLNVPSASSANGSNSNSLAGISALGVSMDLVDGYSIIHKFGINPDIDSGTLPEDIWSGGGPYTGFNPTSAEIVELFSDSADDTALGIGARTVQVFGLDENFLEISETVTMDGLTPVNTVNSYIRLNRIKVISSGSNIFNVGAITARQSVTTANIFAVMPIGGNQSQVAAYTVPANKQGFLTSIYLEASKAQSIIASGGVFLKEFGLTSRIIRPFSLSNTQRHIDEIVGAIKLLPKTDITVRIQETADNNISMTCNFEVILKDVV